MARQSITFEWRFVENDQWWDNLALSEGQGVGKALPFDIDRWLIVNLLRGISLCCISLVALAGTAFTPAERERLRVGAGIYAALLRDGQNPLLSSSSRFQDQPNSGQGLPTTTDFMTSSTSNPDEEIQTQLLAIEPLGELIMAQVWVDQPVTYDWRQPTPYVETRFYQETERGWLQTRPDPTFWGARQIRQTEHLRLLFYSRDAALVEASAADLERIYLALHKLVGLEPPTTTLAIAITSEVVSGRGISSQGIAVTSPTMARVPESLTPSAYLSQSIVSRMSYWVANGMGQTTPPESFAGEWRGLTRGLRGWLRTDQLGQRWPWDAQAAAFFEQHYSARAPLSLATLNSWSETPWEDDMERRLWQAGAAETLFNYVVDTYGRDHLPVLVQGLRQHDTWPELIRAVFDQRVSQFEADWNRYLTEQFGTEAE